MCDAWNIKQRSLTDYIIIPYITYQKYAWEGFMIIIDHRHLIIVFKSFFTI